MTSKKHPSEEDKHNGLSSPAKVPRLDEDGGDRVTRMKELLSKSGGIGGGGRGGPGLIFPKPKPKPKPKPTVSVDRVDSPDRISAHTPRSSTSPDPMDPGPIVLKTDSLKQFSETLDYDFDVVVRHQQILDSTPQKDRALLTQSKGLQNRRLPSNLVTKVPEDYSQRRRNTYAGSMKRAVSQPIKARDEPDGGGDADSVISEEERKQKNLAKLGVQGNNPLAALGNILKRNSSGRGSLTRKSSKKSLQDSTNTPSPKVKKKTSLEAPSFASRFGSEPPQSKSPPKSPKSGFLRGLRRSSSKNKQKKNGDSDDLQSDTSSIVSMPIQSTLDETTEPMEISPTTSPSKSSEKLARGKSTPEPSQSMNGTGGGDDISPLTTVSVQRVPLRDKPSSSPLSSTLSNRKTTDSAIFREGSVEALFGSDSNLFDSSELDALWGKKKERSLKESQTTPKRNNDSRDPLSPSRKPDADKSKGSKKDSFLSISPLPSKPDIKRTSISSPKPGIREQLHRYESNSKVSSKDDDTPLTSTPIIKEDPELKTDMETKTTEVKKKSDLLFEEEDDELFGTTTKVKSTTEEDVDKKAKLFDDDLFKDDSKEPLKTNSETDEKSKDSVKEVKEELSEGKESREVFGEPLDSGRDEEKKKEKTDLFGEERKTDPFGDPLFSEISSTRTESPNKHSTLFDEEEDDNSSLFSRSSRNRAKMFPTHDPLFEDKPKPSSDEKTDTPVKKTTAIESTDSTSITDPLGVLVNQGEEEEKPEKELESTTPDVVASSKDKEDGKHPSPDVIKVTDKAIDESTSEEVTKTDTPAAEVEESTAASSEVKEKSSSDQKGKDAPVSPTKSSVEKAKVPSKDDKPKINVSTDADSKPSWMTELKKRRQVKGSEGTSSASPKEEAIPEWKKKALERKKKAEAATTSTRNTSSPRQGRKSPSKTPSAGRNSPLSDRKSTTASSKISESKLKTDSHSNADEMIKSDTYADETDAKKKSSDVVKESLSSSTVVQPTTKAKISDSKSPTSRPKFKSWREREKEARELAEKQRTEAKESRYKTRREREREAQLQEEKKETEEKADAETTEVKSSYKTRREREREQKEKEEKKKLENGDATSSYKTRREREREEREKSGVTASTYKTRRQREREAKEKEEKEKGESKSEESIEVPDGSPSRSSKPPLTKKPSIEVISRKILSPKQSLSDTSEEIKPKLSISEREDQNAKKTQGEMEDDVFSAGDATEQRSTSGLSIHRTPSPKISIDVVSTVLDSPQVNGDSVENGHKKPSDEKQPKTSVDESEEQQNTTSPTHVKAPNSEASSNKSSVSSERDTNESSRPYRSRGQTFSTSRSPTPPPTGPLKLTDSGSVPEWKRKLMERKKSGSSPVHKTPPVKVEVKDDIPEWKKNLLAKKKNKDDDKDVGPRSKRSITVGAGPTSSPRSSPRSTASSRRNKEPTKTPDFMKEFQSRKQQRNT